VIRVGVITVSDKASRGERVDESGAAIKDMAGSFGGEVTYYKIVPDEAKDISAAIKECADYDKADLILTTGGTGFGPRDITPEATRALIEREAPGISEFIRSEGAKSSKRAILSRAVSGIRGSSLIINLPGSPRAVRESLESISDILSHGIDILKKRAVECAGGIHVSK